MSLSTLQKDFCAWLREDDTVVAARLGLADSRGLPVYQNNYRGALMACLSEVLPHTVLWLGDQEFAAAAAHYIDAHPPVSWTLDAYPEGFPAFLGEFYPNDPEVRELASLEWHLSECFVAPDAEALDLAGAGAIDWESAVLQLVPSAKVMTLISNAAEIWSALAAGETPPAAITATRPRSLVLWRRAFTCHYRYLEEPEVDLFAQMVAGLGFSELCQHLVDQHGFDAGIAAAGGFLARWAGEGLLVVPSP